MQNKITVLLAGILLWQRALTQEMLVQQVQVQHLLTQGT